MIRLTTMAGATAIALTIAAGRLSYGAAGAHATVLTETRTSAAGCTINFRGANSSSRKIWVVWERSDARIASGWWARFPYPGLDSEVKPDGGVRVQKEMRTACNKARRYKIQLYYDANGSGAFNGVHVGDQVMVLYLPSSNSFYNPGTTTVDMGDLYRAFK